MRSGQLRWDGRDLMRQNAGMLAGPRECGIGMFPTPMGLGNALNYRFDVTKDAMRTADCSRVRRPVLSVAW